MSLFDGHSGTEQDSGYVAVGVDPPVRMRIPQDGSTIPCRSGWSGANPDIWFDPKLYPYLAATCEACPFRQWCATEALATSRQYHVVGLWAGIDFSDDDCSGRYRRRLQKLEHIAATGSAPSRRRANRSAA